MTGIGTKISSIDILVETALLVVMSSVLVIYTVPLTALTLSTVVVCISNACFVNNHASATASSLWLIFWLTAMLRPKQYNNLFIFWIIFLILSMIIALTAFAFHFHQFYTPGFGMRSSGLYGTPNVMYPLSLISVCCCVSIAKYCSKPFYRKLGYCGVLLSILVLVMTFSRAGWIALTISACVFLRPKSTWYRYAGSIFCILVILLCFFIRRDANNRRFHDQSSVNRIAIWSEAINISLQHHMIGHGYETFGQAGSGLTIRHRGTIPSEPKNLYLSLLLDYGIFGLALYLFMFACVMYHAQRIAHSMKQSWYNRAIGHSTLLSMASLMIVGIFDTPAFGLLDRTPITTVMLCFMGSTLGIALEATANPNCSAAG